MQPFELPLGPGGNAASPVRKAPTSGSCPTSTNYCIGRDGRDGRDGVDAAGVLDRLGDAPALSRAARGWWVPPLGLGAGNTRRHGLPDRRRPDARLVAAGPLRGAAS